MRYVGWCTEPNRDGDVIGVLMRETADGRWETVSSHYSSGAGWAQHDIGEWHAKPRVGADDNYEWVGTLTPEAAEARFPLPQAST